MTDVSGARPADPAGESPESSEEPSRPTRGFLFADLRDYTRFVEEHGAAEAADLLLRYRALVRDVVSRYRGSEIKTEGDSFYVVFLTVSSAVQCGLAIVAGAAAVVDGGSPIRVGVGVHAGETVETADGFVGSAVNIAARICAQARAGEVLVSDTVRTLTQGILPITYESRGRRQLKGITEQITLYAAIPNDQAAASIRPVWRRRRTWLVAAISGVIAVIVLAAAAYVLAPRGLPPGPWTIGVTLPITGEQASIGIPEVNSVKLAIAEANATGGISGSQFTVDAQNDLADSRDTSLAVAAANALVANTRVLAFVAPRPSSHSAAQIPITNAAGLLECAAANTSPTLTKPRYGAADLRSAAPSRISYIRLAPSDDIQGPAAASFAYSDLAARNALVIDDTTDPGRVVADSFQAAFHAAGGQFTRRALNPGLTAADIASALSPLAAAPTEAPIDVLYFGGAGDTGGPQLRQAMTAIGYGQVPLVSWDGLLDGSGSDQGSYINVAGAAAAGSYATEPTNAPESATFDQHYRAAYGEDPDPYSGAAYACTQVFLESLRAVAQSGPSAEGLREAVRAYATDPANRFDTVLGSVHFDANGDSIQQFVTIHKVDMGANGGAGDWVILKQRDYGPPP